MSSERKFFIPVQSDRKQHEVGLSLHAVIILLVTLINAHSPCTNIPPPPLPPHTNVGIIVGMVWYT